MTRYYAVVCVAYWYRALVSVNGVTPSPVCTEMGDLGSLTNHSGQLSLLPSVGRKMSTGQKVVMLCGWKVKAGTAHFTKNV